MTPRALIETYLVDVAQHGRLELIEQLALVDMVDEANRAFGGPPGRAGLVAHALRRPRRTAVAQHGELAVGGVGREARRRQPSMRVTREDFGTDRGVLEDVRLAHLAGRVRPGQVRSQ